MTYRLKFFIPLFFLLFLVSFPAEAKIEKRMIAGTEVEWDGRSIIEPDSELDIGSLSFADFDDSNHAGLGLFSTKYSSQTERYNLGDGESWDTEVWHIHGDLEGPTVYIVSGTHGNERAGWYAGELLLNSTLKAGELFILPKANRQGTDNRSRYVSNNMDLNRSYPGNHDGNEAQILANAIFSDIKKVNPDIVLDLHEAIIYSPGERDFLGSTFIFTDLEGMEDLFMDMLFATQDGSLCHNEYGYNGPGPKGSLNREVTDLLGIPTITIETFRGFDIVRRVSDQLQVVQFVLQYLNMR